MTEIEVIDAPAAVDVGRAARVALAAAGVTGEAHLAVAFVGPAEIAELNREHRGIEGPTDVLSFPIDEAGVALGPRELGDVVICPEHTEDLTEAVVHGVLHLCGFDHETDQGEMLVLQDRVVQALRCSPEQRSGCAPRKGEAGLQ